MRSASSISWTFSLILVCSFFAPQRAGAQGQPPASKTPSPAAEGEPGAPPPAASDPAPVFVREPTKAPRRGHTKATVRTRSRASASAGMPAVRAESGNWGMQFRFGGLAALTHTGNTRPVGSTFMTHVGIKRVLSENWMVPIYFGMGLGVTSPENGDSSTNFGFEGGAGIEYHFRIWRRISPFVGAMAGLFYLNPTGGDSWTLGLGVGPQVGVEYYIADRVSLTAMYMFSINLAVQEIPSFPDGTKITGFGMETLAGGALSMTYYF